MYRDHYIIIAWSPNATFATTKSQPSLFLLNQFPVYMLLPQKTYPDVLTFLRHKNIPRLNEDTLLDDSNGAPTTYYVGITGVTEDISNNDVPNNRHTNDNDATNTSIELTNAI